MYLAISAQLVTEYAREFPMKNVFRLPKVPYFIENEFLYRLFFVIFNVFPAVLTDFSTKIFKLKPIQMLKLTRQSFVGFKVISAFTQHHVKYGDENLVEVYAKMTDGDRENFPCDERLPSVIQDYLRDIVKGMQKYLMRESEEDLRRSRMKIKAFLFADWIMNLIFFSFAFWLVLKVL